MPESSTKPRLSFSEWGIVAFTASYMLAALVAAILQKNPEFVFYLVVMCILIAITTLVHFQARLQQSALWGLSIWGFAHMAGGLVPTHPSWPIKGDSQVLYNLWLFPDLLKYDQLVHAYGFGLITWICWQVLQRAVASHQFHLRPTPGILTLCVASGMGFGAANEVVEFIATLLLPSTNVGGYENTGWDLVANAVGCLIAAALIRIRWKP